MIAEATLLNPEGQVKDVIYPVAGENILQNLLKEFKSSGPGYKHRVHKIIRSSYSRHYRRMFPKILESLTFCSGNTKHRPALEALEWIEKNRINYEICALQALRDQLRCKEIWVKGADKFRNPKIRLLNKNKKNISITPFEAQEEPSNLISLKREIAGRWPMTGLIGVL